VGEKIWKICEKVFFGGNRKRGGGEEMDKTARGGE
jgi:hypothetical protein